ncbi:MAG TPA: 8-amino-7-oxononanoate synthase [Verrucomicrobiota bacterium]|jgi:8-amino-7-oxononanoate synthase|nr:8-amino-7-oxononanoate synthase [Verrucomicrobiota bacterium]HOH39666.1 8-amino-7-oxononanoate synthase [Verrucomicrobiota bacterium]
MMNDFDGEMARRLAALRADGLWRELRRVETPQSPRLRIGGQTLLNFASNDYLGLANDPAVREAAIRAVEQYGAGAGASRLVCGSLAPHHALDEALAAFKGVEAALSFSSGYASALGALGALLGRGDFVILDQRVHASIVDAARLCGAKLRVFNHNDLDSLEARLKWVRAQASARKARALVVTESVFSMDGDHAPLRELAALKERYGAWLMVDEAHAVGLYGARGRGLAAALGVSERIEVQMGTLGKAMGAAGGYLCGSRALVDCLINRARPFLFSTAPVPAAVAAAAAGVRLAQSRTGEERRARLWQNVARLLPAAPARAPTDRSAIIPIRIGDEARALAIADALRARGIFLPAIRYPTVARGAARLRLTVTAAHTPADLDQLQAALDALGLELDPGS